MLPDSGEHRIGTGGAPRFNKDLGISRRSGPSMSILGDFKGVIDLLLRGWSWRQERRDPVRGQAERLISAFEAHGIARQQIVRLLPPRLVAPPVSFSSPDQLKTEITPTLLTWASNYLGLNRGWLDGVDRQPHGVVRGYKDLRVYIEWFQSRAKESPSSGRWLFVLKSDARALRPEASGPLCLLLTEYFDELDGNEISRHWLLSESWNLEHPPCVQNMMAVVALARSFGIPVIGRAAPSRLLERLEAGTMFAPQVLKHGGGRWYPEDLLDTVLGTNGSWLMPMRQAVRVELEAYGIEMETRSRSMSQEEGRA